MVLPVGGRKPGIPDRTGFELNTEVSSLQAAVSRLPETAGEPQKFLVWDDDVGRLGYFDGPVLVSSFAPYKVDAGSATQTKVQTFLDALPAAGVPGVLLPGLYGITGQLLPKGGVLMANGATIRNDIPSNTPALRFNATVDGMRIVDLEIDGAKSLYAPTTEHRHNIAIYGAKNLIFEDVYTHDAKGDGIYMGPATTNTDQAPENIICRRVVATGNHRNNLSIISVDHFRSYGSIWDAASGTNPQVGVDIEPNFDTEIVRDVRFIGDRMKGNTREGVIVTLKPFGTGAQERIRFDNVDISENGKSGVQLYRAHDVRFRDSDIVDNAEGGVAVTMGTMYGIGFDGGSISRNGHNGVWIASDDLAAIPLPGIVRNVRFHGVDILDNGQVAANTYDGIKAEAYDTDTGYVDGLWIEACTIGNRDGNTQRRAITTSTFVRNVWIVNNDLRNNLSSPLLNDEVDSRVFRNNKGVSTIQTLVAAGTMNQLSEIVQVNPTSASFTATLPANPVPERPYVIVNTNGQTGTYPVTIAANTGHTIRGVSPLTISANFGTVTLIFRANSWYITGKGP